MGYNHAVEVALAAFSQSRCYFPSCRVPAVVTIEDEVVANLRPAPIRGRNFWGSRWDPAMTDEQRHHWANLLLLCHPHHVWVADRRAERYAPEQLYAWKDERERHTMHGLAGLGQVTEADLHRIARDAVRIRDDRLRSAAARLDHAGESQLAEIIRAIDESTDVTVDAGAVLVGPPAVPQPRAAADDRADDRADARQE